MENEQQIGGNNGAVQAVMGEPDLFAILGLIHMEGGTTTEELIRDVESPFVLVRDLVDRLAALRMVFQYPVGDAQRVVVAPRGLGLLARAGFDIGGPGRTLDSWIHLLPTHLYPAPNEVATQMANMLLR